ncbi:BgtAc-31195 [Blumeria graminis f. sp. tritici]|uniref:BgtAc-31195 n=2 Tax=Blumeria graminis f. sp. tritici TaxID=62690 RepID=A0A9X9MLA5_BLUGR|nr:hypothetical protein BGT96224_Ac31195 [Blumeria graminis f. sp. tritici 96224]VDB91373.1 BgtAc-31195 [Blumeria graminis f. sp. tritici]
MLGPPFFILISSAGIWNNEEIYNYNTVYHHQIGSDIQYFSSLPPIEYTSRISRFIDINFQLSRSGSRNFIKPPDYHTIKNQQAFLKSYRDFTQNYIEESKGLDHEYKNSFNYRDCRQQLASISQYFVPTISNIIDGHLSHCNVKLLIELIQSKQLRIGKSERDCKAASHELCIIGDRSVPAQSIIDEFEPIFTLERQDRKAYLVTVAGKLMIILQQSRKKHIMFPKPGVQQHTDIYQFLVTYSAFKFPKKPENLGSALIDLYASSSDEGVSLYRNLLRIDD